MVVAPSPISTPFRCSGVDGRLAAAIGRAFPRSLHGERLGYVCDPDGNRVHITSQNS